MKLVRRLDINRNAYDLVTDDGVEVRLTRYSTTEGAPRRWDFDEVIVRGVPLGGTARVHDAELAAWLEEQARALTPDSSFSPIVDA